MSKAQKIALAIGGALLLALVVYIFWRRRWRSFNNIGDSRYIRTTKNNARLSFRFDDENHGVKVGDRIEVRHGNSIVPDGEMDVIDIAFGYDGFPYVVTDTPMPADNPDITGELRVIS